MDALVEHIRRKDKRIVANRQHRAIITYALEALFRDIGEQIANTIYKIKFSVLSHRLNRALTTVSNSRNASIRHSQAPSR